MGTQKQISRDPDYEQEDQAPAFEIPDTTRTLDALTAALQAEHRAQEEEDDKDKENKNKRKQRRGGSICICESPGCGIGPFIEQSS